VVKGRELTHGGPPSTPNLQLPTPNSQGESFVPSGPKLPQPACSYAFRPEGNNDSPWELEVGSWELTLSILCSLPLPGRPNHPTVPTLLPEKARQRLGV